MSSITTPALRNIIGQDRAKSLLLKAVEHRRIAHAYLFKGPAGVGKRTLARAFGTLLNCQSPAADRDACGECPSCRKFASGNHPDLLNIEADGAAIKIDQIRELKHNLGFPPFEAPLRIIIIADIQTMARESANSLLKVLEEPPPENIIILTARDGRQLLETITSRCQIIPLKPLPLPMVAEELGRDQEITKEQAAALAALSGGSIGQARELAALDLLPRRRELLGTLLEIRPDRPSTAPAVFALAAQAAALKEYLPEFLELLEFWFHDLFMITFGQPDRTLNLDLADLTETALRRWPVTQIERNLKLLKRARRQLARNCGRGPVLEVLFFGLL